MNAKFSVFTIDESAYWRADILAKCGGRIFTVYLFCVGEATHCCSLTPSTYAEAIDYVASADIDDETQETLLAALADADGGYFPFRDAGQDVREFDSDEDDEDAARRDLWDQARESYAANCPQVTP